MEKYLDIEGLKTLLVRLKEQLDTKANTSKLELYTTIDRLNETLTDYVKTTEMNTALASKVDKVSGKGLSSNDYTAAEKNKLATLENYDDSVLVAQVEALEQSLNTLVGNNASEAIDNFNEILRFLAGITDTQTLEGMLANIREEMQTYLASKVDKVTGKQLSTNDYTTEEKTKLSGIDEGAQVNTITGVKGDSEVNYRTGNVSISKANIGLVNVDNTSDINKPISVATQGALDNKVDKVTGKQLSTNDYTTTEKNKLAGIAEGAQVNTVTGIKGNAESSYRTGNVNLTPANIGAAAASHTHDISEVTDLQSTLNGKAASSHVHSANDITSGTLSVERIADGSITSGKIADGAITDVKLASGFDFLSQINNNGLYVCAGIHTFIYDSNNDYTIAVDDIQPIGVNVFKLFIVTRDFYTSSMTKFSKGVTFKIGTYSKTIVLNASLCSSDTFVAVAFRKANESEWTFNL